MRVSFDLTPCNKCLFDILMFICVALICKENLSADSPVSANKPEARGGARRAVSRSSHDHSDEEDAETEAGQSEMTNDPNDVKRMRRYVLVVAYR